MNAPGRLNDVPAQPDALSAEPKLRLKLERLHSHRVAAADDESDDFESQATADTLLARIAWSRMAEPGDGTAGAILMAIGPNRALQMLVAGVKPKAIVDAASAAGVELSPQTVQAALDRWLPRLDRAATITDIDRALAHKLQVVMPGDQDWPSSAFESFGVHTPNMLWLRGNPALLRTQSLSVVGARAATGYGTHTTAEIVDGVCATGLTIVSGAAYGIDAVAHRTALAAEAPTIAVLAGGADRPYPAAHDTLLKRIGEAGLVCSEMVPGSAPTRWRFRMRNRIIAALSAATLVTEAGVRSGTLNTAGHAAELGRTLGAVPGPITSAASAGCHKLIRDYGATLVTSARDACEMLGITEQLDTFDRVAAPGEARTPPLHERVLDAIPLRGTRVTSEIARLAGLTVEETRGGLAELELLGRVQQRETPGRDEPKWGLQRRR